MAARTLLMLVAMLMTGCASSAHQTETRFFETLLSNGDVRLTGWAHVRSSEFMIFPDRRSMRNLLADPPGGIDKSGWPRNTRCITGFFPDWRRARAYDDKPVVVSGTLVDYDTLPERGGDIFPHAKVWGDYAVGNWCYGRKVLLIRSVRLAS